MSVTETTPTIRVRINHSHTLKDGWRLSETTVEYSGESIDWERIELEMTKAHGAGWREATQRNQIETPS